MIGIAITAGIGITAIVIQARGKAKKSRNPRHPFATLQEAIDQKLRRLGINPVRSKV